MLAKLKLFYSKKNRFLLFNFHEFQVPKQCLIIYTAYTTHYSVNKVRLFIKCKFILPNSFIPFQENPCPIKRTFSNSSSDIFSV